MITLCKYEDCTGCGACYNACPKEAICMREVDNGFIHPVIDHDKCIECKLCIKSCPVLTPVEKYPAVKAPIAGINRNVAELTKSSSGGMFSVLADYVLDKGGVVFGAVMGDNGYVFHAMAETTESIAPMRGSKYVQCDTKKTFAEVKQCLKDGKTVLYTGTPCQIAGLRAYLGKTDTANLLCVDIVCHGVPANKMFRTYLEKLSQKKGFSLNDIKEIRFRNYEKWGGFYLLLLLFDGTTILCEKEDNVYLSLFLHSYIYRENCYHCQYATHERVSDITIADFWSIGKKSEFKYDTSRGCSLILPNSEKGKQVFEEIKDRIDSEQRTWEEADLTNHQLYRPAFQPKQRLKAIRAIYNNSLTETYNCIYNTPYIRLRRLAGRILRKVRLKK